MDSKSSISDDHHGDPCELYELEPKDQKVKLEINVSHTDHSHVIGRGGHNVSKVMDETGCRIHFPDFNKQSSFEKSNRVSINGLVEKVELARAKIRDLMPVAYHVEIVYTRNDLVQFLKQVQFAFKVQVHCRQKLIYVKGLHHEFQNVRNAANYLTNWLTEKNCGIKSIFMKLEITRDQYAWVCGPMGKNLDIIMDLTSTTIVPPTFSKNANSTQSTFLIYGSVDGVYSARQKLIGFLPTVLVFDIPHHLNPSHIENVMGHRHVYVFSKLKKKTGMTAVYIKSCERDILDIYSSRVDFLGITPFPSIVLYIPDDYYLTDRPNYKTDQSVDESLKDSGNFDGSMQDSPESFHGYTSLSNPSYESLGTHQYKSNAHVLSHSIPPRFFNANKDMIGMKKLDDAQTTIENSQIETFPKPLHPADFIYSPMAKYLSNVQSSRDVLYHPNNTNLLGPKDTYNLFSNLNSNQMNVPHSYSSQAIPPQFSPLPFNLKDPICHALSQNFQSDSLFNFDTKSFVNEHLNTVFPIKDFNRESSRTLKEDSVDILLERSSKSPDNNLYEIFPFRASNKDSYEGLKSITSESDPKLDGDSSVCDIIEKIPVALSQQFDIASFLSSLNLDKHIERFQSEDIDFDVLVQLQHDDLKALGVRTFGPRKKILAAIQEMLSKDR